MKNQNVRLDKRDQKGIIISSAAHLCIILADGCQRNAQVLSKILHEKQRQEQQQSGDLHKILPSGNLT